MSNDRHQPTRERQLQAWLEFYQELGLTPLYRRRGTPEPSRERLQAPATGSPPPEPARAAVSPLSAPPTSPPTLSLFGEAPGRVEDDTLEKIQADMGECQRCKLAPHRTNIVFGVGNPRARLVFVGEGPGADEDAQGEPFVGRAGQLLTHWIESLRMKRSDVYICNVVKCRPPGNRSPEKDEIQTCSQFLFRQLDTIRPRLICCLGSVALQTLLGKSVSITRSRGQFFDYRGTKLFATFHPAYLLRNPNANRQVQEDLRKIRQFLA